MHNLSQSTGPGPQYTTLFDVLSYFAARTPTRTALVDAQTGQRVSYSELQEWIHELAGWLTHLGLQPGHSVVASFPRTPALIASVLAVSRVGGVCLPLIAPRSAELALQVARDLLSPCLFLYADEHAQLTRFSRPGERWVRYARFLQETERQPISFLPTENSPLYVNNTSGSTGKPKLVIATHRQVLANTEACVKAFALTADDIHLSTFASHAHELFARAVYTGGTAVLLPEADNPAVLLEALSRYGVTCLMSSVPAYTVLVSLAKGRAPHLLLRFAESGGLPTPKHLQQTFSRTFGVPLVSVWGSTETAGVAIAPRLETTHRPDSVGLPLPGYNVTIVRPDGTQVQAEEEGELVVSGPMVGMGYVGKTQEDGPQRLHAGTFRTGDIARQGRDGWISIRGRADNQFKVGGIVVNAEVIEAALCESPLITQALILPVPDRTLGQVPAALVVPSSSIPWSQLDQQQLLTQVEKQLEEPFFSLPRAFVLVPDLPRNAVGKLDRIAARQFLPYREPSHHTRVRLKPIKWLRLAIRAVRKQEMCRFLVQHPWRFLRIVRGARNGGQTFDGE